MFAEMEKGGRSPVYEHVERIRLISELASGAGFWGGGGPDEALAWRSGRAATEGAG